ncbi:nuclear transport factor 2 family protein [Specibacter sp. RAF43]|uniref:nuclear transport factor 2 family protein n=1 Tax=Specibacter sp. RAF43 TaxID=3233057 RepID=UPI003F9E7DFA
MMENSCEQLGRRLQQIEDRLEIQELVVRYGFLVDDHDLNGVKSLFARNGRLRTNAGLVKGEGVDGVGAYFESRFATLGPTNHFVHGHIIEFEDDNRATGLVSSHAEVSRDGAPMLTAMRYIDTYTKVDGRWLFEDRIQSYMYFVDVREYAEALGAKLRIRTSPADAQPGDWPVWFNADLESAAS